jgi:cell division septation protein DedD
MSTAWWYKSLTLFANRLMMAAAFSAGIALVVTIAIAKSRLSSVPPPIIRPDTSPINVILARSDANTPDRNAPSPYRLADATVSSQQAGGTPVAITPDALHAPATPTPRTREASGTYSVQLSAHKSEAEAKAVFRSMQGKYSMLSSRQLLIGRKDRGKRGILYMAQIGPFDSKGGADQLCESLKSAGGRCFVTRN